MLRIEAEQMPQDEPGWCRLVLRGLGEWPTSVELSFRRAGASRNHLGRAGWADAEEWHRLAASRDGDTLLLKLGPPLTLLLGKVPTVEVRVRAQGGSEQRTRLPWPRIVLPPENDAPPMAAPVTIPPDQPAAGAPAPAEPREGLHPGPADRVTSPSRRPRVTVAGMIAAGLVMVIAAGLLQLSMAWWPGAAPVDPAASQARTYTEETVRVFLGSGPDGPSAAAEAALYEAAGHPDLALMLYRDAARRGVPEAALAIGRMYDPEGFAPQRSAFAAPDAEQAAAYYEQAAQAGEAEAQYRLGRLLLSGRTSGDADAERGAVWLQRAAEQGHAEARAALDRLQKRVP